MVIALAGRRIDAEDAKSIRFPAANIEVVGERLQQFFLANMPRYLICSGACGADLLALEVAGELKIKRIMVLPFAAAKFRLKSVTDRPGNWGDLFDKIYKDLDKQSNVIVLNDAEDDKDAYENTNFEILQKADEVYKTLNKDINHSSESGSSKKIALVVWEGKPKVSGDTTDHFRRQAERRSYEIREINCLKP
ncbi:MAG: hypothetical protein M3Z56_01440 [Bacteroidota bacterium]|nr:hypothetical protein [Bacteroidota bacterium]